MSSMVSRRPETPNDFGSDGWPMNHRNEAFWMSMRLGTSRTFSSFENVLRLRGAVVLAGKASPPAGLVGELRSVVPDQGATPKVSSGGPCPQRTGERAACGPNFPSRSGAISAHYTAGPPQVKPTACGTSHVSAGAAGVPATFSGWWHAARCPVPWATSGGSSAAHTSVAYRQRGWKRQPLGGVIG